MTGMAAVREALHQSGTTESLLSELSLLKDDPVRFVASMFPWEEPAPHPKIPELLLTRHSRS